MGSRAAAPTDISRIIHNPVYTGIGPFPRLIDDDMWVKCMTKSVEKNGLEGAYLKMTEAVEESFGISAIAEMRVNESFSGLKRKMKRVGPEQFFADLLRNLRRSLSPLS